MSSRLRFFYWISGFFFVATLLIRLDVITAWPGAEGYSLFLSTLPESVDYLPAYLNRLLFPLGETVDTDTDAVFLFPRLLSALWLLITAWLTYRWAGRLFGKEAIRYGLVAAAASLYLPFFGKVATADTWALCGQAGMLWAGLLFLEGGQRNKLFFTGLFTLIAAIAAPVSTAIAGLGLAVAGLRKGAYAFGGITLVIPVLVALVNGHQGLATYWFLGQYDIGGYPRFLGYCLLGCLPLTGWLLGGLRDLVFKVRRGESASRIYAFALLGSFLAQSLLFPLLLALIAGKQMQLYFVKNYPWKDFVRSGAVLHLVGAFIGVFIILAGGGIVFPGAGFRAALGMVAAYWIFSLLSVVGLFADRRNFAIGGSTLAGILAVMFFWVQVYPYFEAERGWPKRLIEQFEAPVPMIGVGTAPELSTALPYLSRAGYTIMATDSSDFQLVTVPLDDSTTVVSGPMVTGRVVFVGQKFGVK